MPRNSTRIAARHSGVRVFSLSIGLKQPTDQEFEKWLNDWTIKTIYVSGSK
jgi:hypothetical protein